MSNYTSEIDEDISTRDTILPRPHHLARRSFIRSLGVGAALLSPMAGLLTGARRAAAQVTNGLGQPDSGDIAILRFVAAAELIETDFWQQYTELAVGNPSYGAALAVLDEDMAQYIIDNTDDERSHAAFLNAYLRAVGGTPVNLDQFRTLPSSQATGAKQIGRLTNLMKLTVDTSWWIRYRSHENPDFGDTFPQFIKIVNRPAIPPHDFPMGSKQIQAIANTAAFHFPSIEQGGSSLYSALGQLVTDVTVLKIMFGIGGAEVNHFAIWHDKAGNAPAVSVPGVTFPDMESFNGQELKQKNLIMPEPCDFISESLPDCSVIRPSSIEKAGAVAAVNFLTNSNLFQGQSPAFFDFLRQLAQAADAASRNGP
jgi:hypothetical protein